MLLKCAAFLALCAWAVPARASDTPYGFGADLSFLKQQEDADRIFRDRGAAQPCLRIFRDHGYGWVRLRLFHSPTVLPNSLAYTLAMARQAKALGFRLLLDLHYSDTWADPDSQSPPAAWTGLAHAQLQDSVFAYTREVIARFYAEGAVPEMVQIGNEINAGILWPDGRSADFGKLADLLKAGIRGADSGAGSDQPPRIMLHLASGGDTVATRWFVDNALSQGIPFDAIGQSYYPMWHGTPADLARNLSMMGRRYDKDVYVVETAFAAYPDGTAPFPLTDAGQTSFLRLIDSLVRATPNGHGKGWMWWEPTGEAYLGTPRGLFDKDGNARPALYAFDGQVSISPPPDRPKVTESLPQIPRSATLLFATPEGPVDANGTRSYFGKTMKAIHKDISAYHRALSGEDKAICDLLKTEIEKALPRAEAKIWHGSPVWFLDGNPIVGYRKSKDSLRLLFWSGQSFEENGLVPEGTFKAAEVRYHALKEVKPTPLRRWLAKSKKIQWDYKNIVKRKGRIGKTAAIPANVTQVLPH